MPGLEGQQYNDGPDGCLLLWPGSELTSREQRCREITRLAVLLVAVDVGFDQWRGYLWHLVPMMHLMHQHHHQIAEDFTAIVGDGQPTLRNRVDMTTFH